MTEEELNIQKALDLQRPNALLLYCKHCTETTVHIPAPTAADTAPVLWVWMQCTKCKLYSTKSSFTK